MITIQDVIKWSKPHPRSRYNGDDSRETTFGNKHFYFSIVGGGKGFYGNFKQTFEVAILDVKTRDFVTKYVYSEMYTDVIPWMRAKDLEILINSLVKLEDLSVER